MKPGLSSYFTTDIRIDTYLKTLTSARLYCIGYLNKYGNDSTHLRIGSNDTILNDNYLRFLHVHALKVHDPILFRRCPLVKDFTTRRWHNNERANSALTAFVFARKSPLNMKQSTIPLALNKMQKKNSRPNRRETFSFNDVILLISANLHFLSRPRNENFLAQF